MKKLVVLLIAAALASPVFAAETKKPDVKKAEKVEAKKEEKKPETIKQKIEAVKEKIEKKANPRQNSAVLGVRG